MSVEYELEHDPWEGRLLDGRFRVRERTATNGMIRTYVGEHVELERSVTIKRLVVGDRRGRIVEETRARFLRESAELARLSHPNIVRIYERGEVDGVPYIVTERIRGVSLERHLAESDITPALAIDIVDEVCRALGVAHAAGVVHQGLKPDAIYIRSDTTGELVVRLVDFGVADDFHTLTHEDARLRVTPWYVAPEQARRAPADARTDVYGMGCLLYRLWTGRTPFEHLSGPSVLVAHVRLPPPSLQELKPQATFPGIFDWTVQRCLAKDPADRFASAPELRRALQLCRIALLRPDLRFSPKLVDGELSLDEQLDPLLLGSDLVLTR